MADEPKPPAELMRRLPATFGPALNDQFRQWNLLFPAEQRQLRTQLDCLSHLPSDQFDRLFAPLLEIESHMTLPRWEPGAVGLSVRDVGILARSPLYPKWRSEVERVFGEIDAASASSGVTRNLRRLLVCILPRGIPLERETLWPEMSKVGSWIALARPFGDILPAFAMGMAKRECPPTLEEIERTWIFESDRSLAGTANVTELSWDALAPLRREFLRRFNSVQRDLRSVDQTSADLKRAPIDRLLDPSVAPNPRLREFVRTLLLSGNGSLVFENSFVEWGSSEALRRVQPQVLFAAFGIRKKLKPFSSVVLFEDQTRSNPVPDEDDPAGSLADAAMLSQYVYLGAQRVACYPGNLVTLMAACDLNRVLVLAPAGARFRNPAPEPVDLTALALRWLTIGK